MIRKLLPRSLYGRLLSLSVIATLVALAVAAVAIGGILDRFVGGTIDARLADRLVALETAVRPDGSIDPAVVARLSPLVSVDEPWRIDAPHGTAGTRRGGLPVVQFDDDPQYRQTPPLPPRAGQGPRGPLRLPVGVRLFDADLSGGTAVHGLLAEVATDAGPATVIATVPRWLIQRPVRAALMPLTLSLLALGVALAAATLVQLRIGLRPLARMRGDLTAIRAGTAETLPENQPTELAPLAAEINALLADNAAALANARSHVANLTHGLKTPLATLALALPPHDPDGALQEQVARIDRAVRHHLARARAATPGGALRVATPLAPVVADLTAALARIHADRAITAAIDIDSGLTVAVDRQDLDELIGNLLDNGWRHARARLIVSAHPAADQRFVQLTIADDGPGIPPDARSEALAAGQRLDERGDGYGFGLSIAQELGALYGGTLTLDSAALGGLAAIVTLPRPAMGPAPGAGVPLPS